MIRNQKLLLVLFLSLFIPVTCLAYIWSGYGPSEIETYNFYVFGGGIAYEIICEENGIIVNEGADWTEYSYYDLPVWDVETVMTDSVDIITVVGNGTDSDGIYGFDFADHEYQLLHWLLNPRFILYCTADSSYYAGGEGGLCTSHDGLNWEDVPFFATMQCLDMEVYQEHYVVSTSGNVYYSSNAGDSWTESNTMQYISDLVVSSDGIFYGVFPDESWSSGFYCSTDNGMNWSVEFWSVNLSCSGFDDEGHLFVGWEVPQTVEQGVAQWWSDISQLEYMNEGLPDFNVNRITSHPLLDCLNILICTDSGLYLLTDYTSGIEPEVITSPVIQSHNYPNPFNPVTEISFQLPDSGMIDLDIYNSRGQIVKRLYNGFLPSGDHSLIWNGTNDNGHQLASGIYHYRINSISGTCHGKMMLLK